jgi:hypothetical protein
VCAVFWRLVIAALICNAPFSGAQTNPAATSLALQPLGNGQFKLGLVRLDKRERSVIFPARPNITADLAIEYAVVNDIGKLHESLFRTAAKAQEIHLAMLLLGAKAAMTNAFPDDLSVAPPGEKVTIEVSWKEKGKSISRRMEDLILNRVTGKSLSRGFWVYNGSNFSEGMFTAQRDGSIISIHIDPDALINNPRPGRDNDDLHAPLTESLPSVDTSVEIKIRLDAADKVTK